MSVVNRGNAEHYRWGEVCDGWRLSSGNDLSVIEERIPPGRGEIAHFHRRARQVFYVLTGRLVIHLPDCTRELRPSDSLEVGPQTVHRVHNPFEQEVTFLVISSPSTAEDRINV